MDTGQTAADGQTGEYKVTMEIDSRLTLPAGAVKEWASEHGLNDFPALVSAPGFPAPTDSTADLPLNQREWPMAAIWVFMLRADGFVVHDEGEMETPIPCMMKLTLCKVD
jgi:hypothetical protein